ncbi:MAG: hypothetical protein ABIC04_00035 [Nanoarchaeota archaeon]
MSDHVIEENALKYYKNKNKTIKEIQVIDVYNPKNVWYALKGTKVGSIITPN